MTECWVCVSHRGKASGTVLHTDPGCEILESAYSSCSVGDVDTDQYPVCGLCRGEVGGSGGGGDYSYYKAAVTAEAVGDE